MSENDLGEPVTRHALGQGVAYYLGTRPEEAYMKQLLATVCREAGVEAPLDAPLRVEVVHRKTGEASYLFILNHGAQPAKVHLDKPARDLLAGSEHRRTLTLEPLAVAVLQEAG